MATCRVKAIVGSVWIIHRNSILTSVAMEDVVLIDTTSVSVEFELARILVRILLTIITLVNEKRKLSISDMIKSF